MDLQRAQLAEMLKELKSRSKARIATVRDFHAYIIIVFTWKLYNATDNAEKSSNESDTGEHLRHIACDFRLRLSGVI